MKTIKSVSLAIILAVFLSSGVVNAQKVGVAADKQKQENLEKNKKRQQELKKKYNSMTPEQAAEAEKRANEYKKTGGKTKPAVTTTKPAGSSSKPTGSAVSKTKQTPKQGNVQKKGTAKQPVWMDANGKPKPATSGKTTTKQEVKPNSQVKSSEKAGKATTAAKPKASSEQAKGTKK